MKQTAQSPSGRRVPLILSGMGACTLALLVGFAPSQAPQGPGGAVGNGTAKARASAAGPGAPHNEYAGRPGEPQSPGDSAPSPRPSPSASLFLPGPPGATDTTGPIGTTKGTFQAVCGFSHRSQDDPIVYPGKPGASHSHEFFGSRTTDAFSTPETIRRGPTTCIRYNTPARSADRSAYWVPTLYVGDERVQASQVSAYYKTGVRRVRAVEPFPEGLKVIAGTASGGPQELGSLRVWDFLCPAGTLVNGSATRAPTCATKRMDLVIRFPDCWDGVNLDSPDHKSHLAYSRRRGGAEVKTCPSSHPRLMPELEIILRYPTTGGPGARLASGPVNTAHADFVNGWNQRKQEELVRDCLNVDRYCGGGDAPVVGE